MNINVKRLEERREYKQFRYRAILRANRKCEICGKGNTTLRLVYLKERSIFPELVFRPDNAKIICPACHATKWPGSDFGEYTSFCERPEWKQLRQAVIEQMGCECRHCHRTPDNPSEIQVDHKQPKFIFPELAFSISNLEPLCAECNEGKGAAMFENTITKSLLSQQQDRVRDRLKAFESRYLEKVVTKIEEEKRDDFVSKYVIFRHGARRAYAFPSSLDGIITKAEPDLRLLETAPGETFSLFMAG